MISLNALFLNDKSHDDTRHRLILAGLAAFNLQGYEGASTRQIVAEAGTNISSIAYHFGCKEKLYLAVADYIATEMGHKVDELEHLLGEQMAAVRTGTLPRADAVVLVQQVCKDWLNELFVLRRRNQTWSAFIFREQSNPTPAFDILYEKGIGRFLEILAGLFACIEQRAPTDFCVRFRAFTLFGQMLSFEYEQATLQRYFGWKQMDQQALEQIGQVINRNIERLANTTGCP